MKKLKEMRKVLSVWKKLYLLAGIATFFTVAIAGCCVDSAPDWVWITETVGAFISVIAFAILSKHVKRLETAVERLEERYSLHRVTLRK